MPKSYQSDLVNFYDSVVTGRSFSFLHANIRSMRKNFNSLVAKLAKLK